MKNVVYLAATFLFLTASCSKDQDISSDHATPQQKQIEVKGITLDGVVQNTRYFNLDEALNPNTVSSNDKYNQNQVQNYGSINGHFNAGPNGQTMSFSGVENNGGIHGNANFDGEFDFKFSTACISVVGNRGVIAGNITQITALPNGLDTLLFVGDYVYFLLIDNGEGANSALDQYSQQFYFSPAAGGPLCHLIPANSAAWDPAWTTDVYNASDQIQVD